MFNVVVVSFKSAFKINVMVMVSGRVLWYPLHLCVIFAVTIKSHMSTYQLTHYTLMLNTWNVALAKGVVSAFISLY